MLANLIFAINFEMRGWVAEEENANTGLCYSVINCK